MKNVSANPDLFEIAHAVIATNPAESMIAGTIVLIALAHAFRHAF